MNDLITHGLVGGGGVLGTVIVYLKFLRQDMEELKDMAKDIHREVRATNGKVTDHEIRLRVLEEHDEAA